MESFSMSGSLFFFHIAAHKNAHVSTQVMWNLWDDWVSHYYTDLQVAARYETAKSEKKGTFRVACLNVHLIVWYWWY